jgi:hypothetical protein
MKHLFLIFACLFSSVAAANDNIVVVLDNSGSMGSNFNGQTRMQAAKNALKSVLNSLPDTTNIGLVTINPVIINNERTNWIFPIGPIDKQKLNHYADSLVETGGTPLGAFIKVGADSLLEFREKQKYGNYQLIVITDGEANDNGLLEQYVPDVMRRGVRFDVIGVGLSNHTLSKKVSSYRSADNPTALTQAVQEVLAEIPQNDDSSNDYELIQSLPSELASSVIKTYVEFPNEKIDKAPDYSSLLNSLQTDEGTSIALIILVMIIAGGVLMVIVALFS